MISIPLTVQLQLYLNLKLRVNLNKFEVVSHNKNVKIIITKNYSSTVNEFKLIKLWKWKKSIIRIRIQIQTIVITLRSSTSFCSRSELPAGHPLGFSKRRPCNVSTLVLASSNRSVCLHKLSNNTPFSSPSLSLSVWSSVSCVWRSASSCRVAWSSSLVL